MNIRSLLTLRFILLVAVILVMALLLIYFFSADYREETFYDRLRSKANTTAKLFVDVDEVDATLLTKIETDNPVSLPDEKIIIFDYQNNVLFSTDHAYEIHVDKNLLDRIRLEDEVKFKQGNYEALGFLFKGQFDRFAVVAAATDIHGLGKLKNLRAILLAVFALSVIVVSISGWFFSTKALQPISKVVRQVDEISITSLNLRVDEGNGSDEIAHLAQTFNNMLKRLEDSFNLQKNFIANASHELRTPLTAITGQLEVTLLNSRSNEDYQKVIQSVLEDIRNLNNLSNRLLMLAHTNSDTIKLKITEFRIDEVIWEVCEDFQRLNPDYKIVVDLDEKLDDELKLIVHADEQLIRVAISNLIENGCKYSRDHTIKVGISSGSNLTLRFEDKGIGIPLEDVQNVFEPFYRAENTKNIKGHGMGLSMVKRIVLLHHGNIVVNSNEGIGTTFTVQLPVHAKN